MGLLVLYIPALFWVLCFSALVLVLYYNQVGVLIIRVTTQLRLIAVWFGPTVLDWYPFQHVLNVFLKCSSYLIAQPNYIYFLFFWILQWSTVFHNHCYVVLLFLFNILFKEHMFIHMQLSMIFQICHSYSILRAYWYRYIILSSLKLDSSRLLHFWYFIWAFRKDIFLNCLGFYAFKHWCYSDVIIRLGYL